MGSASCARYFRDCDRRRPDQIAAARATVREIDKLLDALIAVATPVHPGFFRRPLLRDPDDNMVLETALSGKTDLLVTFNERDFQPTASKLGIEVLTPPKALKKIEEEL